MADSSTANYIELAADIVSAYVSNNSVSAGDLPGLINSVHNALLNVTSGKVEAPAEPLKPVVPVKKSITPDYIICLEDGKKFKSLKRHLRTQYNLSPEDYREKWGLPPTIRWSPPTTPLPARSSPSRWASASSAAARAAEPSPVQAHSEGVTPHRVAPSSFQGRRPARGPAAPGRATAPSDG